ncbi:hypothetical protein Ciccas_004092 [Cichlidogyrus casuarinus]|uniref:Sex-determining region Y protein n=1 Tax=Cichlidogyrus casuarinus TaxID=1844966 RepID=A0ABD2QCH0_9PLAT
MQFESLITRAELTVPKPFFPLNTDHSLVDPSFPGIVNLCQEQHSEEEPLANLNEFATRIDVLFPHQMVSDKTDSVNENSLFDCRSSFDPQRIAHVHPIVRSETSSVPSPSLVSFFRASLTPSLKSYEEKVTTKSSGSSRRRRRAEHIKRPMNAFLVWSKDKRREIAKANPKMHNSEISKALGQMWKNLTQEERTQCDQKSRELRDEHKRLYPDYKYKPRRKPKTPNQQLPTRIGGTYLSFKNPMQMFATESVDCKMMDETQSGCEQSQTDFAWFHNATACDYLVPGYQGGEDNYQNCVPYNYGYIYDQNYNQMFVEDCVGQYPQEMGGQEMLPDQDCYATEIQNRFLPPLSELVTGPESGGEFSASNSMAVCEDEIIVDSVSAF